MRVTPEKIIESELNKEIKIDNPQVKMLEMKLHAIERLADEKNLIFSQLSGNDESAFSKAFEYSKNSSLSPLQERLNRIGIHESFEIPELSEYLTQRLVQRHKVQRRRVQEYLDGLKNIDGKSLQETTPQPGLLGGLRRMI